MIKVTVLYPTAEGSTFDHDYFRDTHVPMACKAWGLSGAEINKGLNGPYTTLVHFTFDDMDAVNAALGAPATADVLADVPKYTNIQPVIQTSEIVD